MYGYDIKRKKKRPLILEKAGVGGTREGLEGGQGGRTWYRYRTDIKFSKKKIHSDTLRQIQLERPHSCKSHYGLLSALLAN